MPSVSSAQETDKDFVSLELRASRTSCLPGEQFEVELRVAIKSLSGENSLLEPLDPSNPPLLTVPFLTTRDIPDLRTTDIRTLLGGKLVKRTHEPGFILNNFSVGFLPLDPVKRVAGDEVPAKFRFDRVRQNLNGSEYNVYYLKLIFTPLTETTLTFGPVTFDGHLITDIDPGGHINTKLFHAAGDAVKVNVVPPPLQDRPESFTGAIGYSLSAETKLDLPECRAGEPLKVELMLTGKACFRNITPPPIWNNADISKLFRVYPDILETSVLDDSALFVYMVRPLREGAREFPSIRVPFYNLNDREYQWAESMPVPINVLPGYAPMPSGTGGKENEKTLVPAPIKMNPSGSTAVPVAGDRNEIVFLLLLGPAVYFLSRFIPDIRDKIMNSYINLRSGITCWRIPRRLRDVSRNHPENSEDILCALLKTYARARFSMKTEVLVPSEVFPVIKAEMEDDPLAEEFTDVFKKAFDARYSKEKTVDIAFLADEAARVVEKINLRKKQAGNINISFLPVLLVFFISLSNLCAAEKNDGIRQFLWEAANRKMATSCRESDFAEAVKLYKKLENSGAKNGCLYYNMGTAMMMAGDCETAVDALIAAERYSGTTWAIKRNMMIALSQIESPLKLKYRWLKLTLPWHHMPSLQTIIRLIMIIWVIFWILLAMRRGVTSCRGYKLTG